jgi:hypothetical protein
MISRKTTVILADLLSRTFYKRRSNNRNYIYSVDSQAFYDFLFELDYQAWFCNLASSIYDSGESFVEGTRKLKEFVMKLHTGDSIVTITPQWTLEQRIYQGQILLEKLCQDILNKKSTSGTDYEQRLKRSLELDGYLFVDGVLRKPDVEVLNIVEEVNLLTSLYSSLSLANSKTAFHHLSLSEDHYEAGRWDDSISNSR